MSFSGYITVDKGLGETEVEDAVNDLDVSGNDDCPDERETAVSAACAAAADIINSGAVGDPDAIGFKVSISGHVNPQHVMPAGNSPDSVTVSVAAIIEPPTPAAA